MALHLRVINDHRQLAGNDTATFGTDGGSIGRTADNDWVLPDPQRYVSAHHARVHCHDGQYYLEDISTNGVYVNDQHEPLAKQESNSHRLHEGDVLRIGEYRIQVSLEDADSADSAVMPSRILALHPVGPAQTDIGAVLDLDDLLAVNPVGDAFAVAQTGPQPVAPETRESGATKPGAASGRAAPPGATQGPASTAHPRRTEPTDHTVERRMARLARAAGRGGDNGAGSPADAALLAFCRGAGIKPAQVPAQAQALLHLAGQLLRESMVGLKDVERAHGQLRAQFGINVAPREPGPDPSLGRSTVEDLLLTLIRQHEEHSLDAVRWLRERHDEIKARERAVAQAVRAAFLEFVGRLDPAELEARFARSAGGKAGTGQWEQFTSFYRNLRGPADQLPHGFLESFAEAYRDALRPTTVDIPDGTGAFRSLDKPR